MARGRLVLDENFDAADAAAWPAGRWRTTSGGGTATVQSRMGRLATPASAFGDIRALCLQQLPVDFELFLTVQLPSSVATDGFFCNIRSPSSEMTFWTFRNCYEFRLGDTGYTAWYRVLNNNEGSPAPLVSGGPPTSSALYGLRIRAVGSRIQSRFFNTASYEPQTWEADFTDPMHKGTWFSLAAYSSDATAGVNFDFDTIQVWDLTKRPNTEG